MNDEPPFMSAIIITIFLVITITITGDFALSGWITLIFTVILGLAFYFSRYISEDTKNTCVLIFGIVAIVILIIYNAYLVITPIPPEIISTIYEMRLFAFQGFLIFVKLLIVVCVDAYLHEHNVSCKKT